MNYRFQTYISNSITGLYLALPQKKHYFFLWSENRLIDCSLALSEQHGIILMRKSLQTIKQVGKYVALEFVNA
jgi:hypothetical protein